MQLNKLRAEKGMTQEDLAKKLGVKRSTLSMWELGKSVPKPTMLRRIANELGVSVETILSCFESEEVI